MNAEQKELLENLTTQDQIRLKFVTDIVSKLVTDANLAKSVNDAITSKLTPYNAAVSKAVAAEQDEVDLSQEIPM